MSSDDRNKGLALCIALAPELLTAVVRQDERVVAHSEVRTTNGHWRGALQIFDAYLRQSGSTLRGVHASVSLAARWCQLLVLPWSESLRDSDAQLYAQSHFVAVFGEAAHGWAFVLADAPPGQARLACAVEREFHAGLRDIAREHGHDGMTIECIVSIAGRAIDGNRHKAFALIEPGRLVLAALHDKQVVAVQAQDCRGPWHQELPMAWRNWVMRTPALGDIAQVALVSLDDRAAAGDVPAPFEAALMQTPVTAVYAAVTMMGC